MPFVGLVSDPRWEPPDSGGGAEPPPEPARPARRFEVPWVLLGWLVALVGLVLLVPVLDRAVGSLAGYLLLCATIALGFWRFDRWVGRHDPNGLRDYRL
jgi:hypothetical protein